MEVKSENIRVLRWEILDLRVKYGFILVTQLLVAIVLMVYVTFRYGVSFVFYGISIYAKKLIAHKLLTRTGLEITLKWPFNTKMVKYA